MHSFVLAVAQLVTAAGVTSMGLPMGIPPGPEDPALARIAPQQCLFYYSWAPMASPSPNSPNQTEQLLAEPEVQYFLKQIQGCVCTLLKTSWEQSDPGMKALGDGLVENAGIVLRHSGAVFVSKITLTDQHKVAGKGKTPPESPDTKMDVDAGIVLSLGEDAPRVKAWLDKVVQAVQKAASQPKKKEQAAKADTRPGPAAPEASVDIKDVQIAGRHFLRVRTAPDNPLITLGFYDNYFIAAMGDKTVEEILARLTHAPPQWLADTQRQLTVDRRSTLMYVNLGAIAELVMSQTDGETRANARTTVGILGLANATSVVEVTGLDGEDFVYKTLLRVDGRPRGLLQLLADRPLRPADLAPIPRDSTLALAFRLDLQRTADIVRAAVEKQGPEGREACDQAVEGLEKSLGFDLRHGVLRSFGDTWCLYNSPGEGGFILTGLTGVVSVQRDAPLRLIYSRLRYSAQNWLQNPLNLTSADDSPSVGHFSFQGHEVGYLNAPIAPSWCLTREQLIFGMSPQNVKAYLSRGARHRPINQLPQVAGLFTKDDAPVLVAYCDSPKLFELLYPWLMFYAPAIVNGLQQQATLGRPAQQWPKFDVDLSLLPSAPAIGRHLRPSLLTLHHNKYGVELDARGTIPLGGPLELPLLQVVSLLPGYVADPVRRTEELTSEGPPPRPGVVAVPVPGTEGAGALSGPPLSATPPVAAPEATPVPAPQPPADH